MSLSVLLPKAASKNCDNCSGTGSVWVMGTWIFCQRCLGDRVTSIWAWIDGRYFGFRNPPSRSYRKASSVRS